MKQMRWAAVLLVWWSLHLPGSATAAAPESLPGPMDCAQLAALLQAENSRLGGELRRIQREVAALRADLEKPGLPEVVGGIGYILGLFGVAAFVAARRRKE